MNPKEIEAFRAVMLSGSMTVAARDIHTTQPNVSRLIAHLEYQLDMKLFERAGNKLMPTDEAFAFFSEVERYYLGLKTLKDTARNIKQFGAGRLRVATAPALSGSFLARVVARFSEQRPGVTLSVSTNYSEAIENLVASQLADLALAVFVGNTVQSAVNAEQVVSVRGVCILPPGHRLADAKTIKAADLADEHFVSLSHHDGLRERIDEAFQSKRVVRRMTLETEFMATICQMVLEGLGVSVVSPIMARDYESRGLIAKPFAPAVSFPISLLSSKHRPTGILAKAFIDAVMDVLAADGYVLAKTRG